MSVQTEVVIAEANEAQKLADSARPSADREGFTHSGFDHVQLCTLLSKLKVGNWDGDFERYLDAIDVVSSSSGDFPSVAVVKPELVEELAELAGYEDEEFESLANSWAGTEEFEGWSSSDVSRLLRDLVDLAESAASQNSCIMIWQDL